MARFEDSIGIVLQHEGGFVNHPNDPGGVTNFGVSLRFLAEHPEDGDFDGDGDVDGVDIRRMTVADAKRIYRKHFWVPHRYDRINNQAVATKIFDMTVNMGARRSHILTQTALNTFGLNLATDGVLGPRTISAINGIDSAAFLAELRRQCAGFYRRLIEQRPSLKVFERGWMARAAS